MHPAKWWLLHLSTLMGLRFSGFLEDRHIRVSLSTSIISSIRLISPSSPQQTQEIYGAQQTHHLHNETAPEAQPAHDPHWAVSKFTIIVVMIQCITAHIPLYKVPGLVGDWHLWGKDEGFPPVHHFAVGLLGVLRAERGVTCTSHKPTVTTWSRLESEPVWRNNLWWNLGKKLIISIQSMAHGKKKFICRLLKMF